MAESSLPRQTPHDAAITGQTWLHASSCQSGECVEVSRRNGVIFLRDSKEADRCVLSFPVQHWRSFVRAIKVGEFESRS
jgi:hypothetical protein